MAFRNLVGFIYSDPVKGKVRLGYLTFRGRREDTVLDIEDIKPFSETQKFKLNLVNIIETYTDDRKYKIVDMGGVLRRDEYEMIFGR